MKKVILTIAILIFANCIASGRKDHENLPAYLYKTRNTESDTVIEATKEFHKLIDKYNKQSQQEVIDFIKTHEIDFNEQFIADYPIFFSENDRQSPLLHKMVYSPLTYAVDRGFKDTVKLLLEKGCNVNELIKSYEFKLDNHISTLDGSPLHIAALRDNSQMIDLLISHNADIKLPDDFNLTPVELAIKYRKLNALKKFIELNVDLSKYEKSNRQNCFLDGELKQDIVDIIESQPSIRKKKKIIKYLKKYNQLAPPVAQMIGDYYLVNNIGKNHE